MGLLYLSVGLSFEPDEHEDHEPALFSLSSVRGRLSVRPTKNPFTRVWGAGVSVLGRG